VWIWLSILMQSRDIMYDFFAYLQSHFVLGMFKVGMTKAFYSAIPNTFIICYPFLSLIYFLSYPSFGIRSRVRNIKEKKKKEKKRKKKEKEKEKRKAKKEKRKERRKRKAK